MVNARKILKEIVARVKHLVDPVPFAAKDIRSDAVKLLALGGFDGAAYHGGVRQFDIGIEKENVIALGLGRAQVAADRGHSAANHADVQAVAKSENNLGSAID